MRWCEWDTRMRALKDAYLWWEMRVKMGLSTSTQGFSSYTVSKKALATKWQHQIETKKLNQRPYQVKLSTVVLIGWQRPLKNLLTLGTWFYNNPTEQKVHHFHLTIYLLVTILVCVLQWQLIPVGNTNKFWIIASKPQGTLSYIAVSEDLDVEQDAWSTTK